MPRTGRQRGLRAVVFVDTVGSTKIAAELGDERWQRLLARELTILRDVLRRDGGREVDVAGDGLFALFDDPESGIRFAADAAVAVREIGLEIRAGVHFGECDLSDGRPSGIVVHTGARVMGVADAGQVVATSTVVDLMPGGAFGFTEHGVHELKGVPGTRALFRLEQVDADPVDPPLTDDEATERRRHASAPVATVPRRTFLAGIAAAAAVGAGTVYLLTRSEDEPTAVVGNRLLRFDPSTGSVDPSPVALPSLFFAAELPCLAVGEGAVWAGDRTGLHQIDQRSGTSRRTIKMRGGGGGPVALSIGFDDVWAVSDDSLARIDPADGDVLERLPFPEERSGIISVLAAYEDVWVAFEAGALLRVAPAEKLSVVERLQAGDLPTDMVAAGGAVWVTDGFGALARVDPDTNRIETLRLGGAPQAVAATADTLWIADTSGVVVAVDTARMAIERSVAVGGHPVDVAAGLDAVWVADLEGRLVWLDPIDYGIVGHRELEGQPGAIAVDEDQSVVWIRTFSGPPRN
jgi:class 3 adenylate cyclase/streptogramin lyase